MKRSWKITAVAAGVLLLAGCGNQTAQKQDAPQGKTAEKQTEKESPAGGMITSIKEAMGLGATMECTYKEKDENGKEIVSKAYVKGEKYKATNTINGKNYIVLGDDKFSYSWIEGEKTGEKYDLHCFDDLPKNTDKAESDLPASEDPEKEFDDATDVSCKETSGIDFSVPSDINFADQCEMMKNFQKAAQSNIPADMPQMPAGMPDMSNVPQMP